VTEGGPAPAPVWQPAIALLDDIARRAEAGAVVRAAIRAGVLARLHEPATLRDLANEVGASAARLADVLEVLRSLGIVDADGDTWRLTEPWAAVVAGESPMDFEAYADMSAVRMQQFERSLTDSVDYWQLSREERLRTARGVSFNPASPVMPAMLRRDLGMLDGVIPALESGGRVLELGCGVGSRLTALALTFPETRAVGVELDADLVDFGRQRAAALGVADRVTYVTGDARTYEPDGDFALVTWSQFFFPTETRAEALATAFNALRPGGWVTAPVIWLEGATTEGVEAEELALEALNLDMWGVPARTTAEVVAEMKAAGFTDTRVDDMTYVHLVRGRRP